MKKLILSAIMSAMAVVGMVIASPVTSAEGEMAAPDVIAVQLFTSLSQDPLNSYDNISQDADLPMNLYALTTESDLILKTFINSNQASLPGEYVLKGFAYPTEESFPGSGLSDLVEVSLVDNGSGVYHLDNLESQVYLFAVVRANDPDGLAVSNISIVSVLHISTYGETVGNPLAKVLFEGDLFDLYANITFYGQQLSDNNFVQSFLNLPSFVRSNYKFTLAHSTEPTKMVNYSEPLILTENAVKGTYKFYGEDFLNSFMFGNLNFEAVTKPIIDLWFFGQEKCLAVVANGDANMCIVPTNSKVLMETTIDDGIIGEDTADLPEGYGLIAFKVGVVDQPEVIFSHENEIGIYSTSFPEEGVYGVFVYDPNNDIVPNAGLLYQAVGVDLNIDPANPENGNQVTVTPVISDEASAFVIFNNGDYVTKLRKYTDAANSEAVAFSSYHDGTGVGVLDNVQAGRYEASIVRASDNETIFTKSFDVSHSAFVGEYSQLDCLTTLDEPNPVGDDPANIGACVIPTKYWLPISVSFDNGDQLPDGIKLYGINVLDPQQVADFNYQEGWSVKMEKEGLYKVFIGDANGEAISNMIFIHAFDLNLALNPEIPAVGDDTTVTPVIPEVLKEMVVVDGGSYDMFVEKDEVLMDNPSPFNPEEQRVNLPAIQAGTYTAVLRSRRGMNNPNLASVTFTTADINRNHGVVGVNDELSCLAFFNRENGDRICVIPTKYKLPLMATVNQQSPFPEGFKLYGESLANPQDKADFGFENDLYYTKMEKEGIYKIYIVNPADEKISNTILVQAFNLGLVLNPANPVVGNDTTITPVIPAELKDIVVVDGQNFTILTTKDGARMDMMDIPNPFDPVKQLVSLPNIQAANYTATLLKTSGDNRTMASLAFVVAPIAAPVVGGGGGGGGGGAPQVPKLALEIQDSTTNNDTLDLVNNTVALKITRTNNVAITKMRVSSNNNFEGAAWIDYSEDYIFAFPADFDGELTVYAQAKKDDNLGNKAHDSTMIEREVALQADGGIAQPFNDIDDHWAKDFIDELRLMGVIDGKKPGVFDPDGGLTRAEITKVALELFGYEVDMTAPSENPFPDVDKNEWYAPYIAAGKANKVVSGYGDGTFQPDKIISRAEALRVFLEAALDYEIVGDFSDFSFPDIIYPTAWYNKYVSFAILNNIMSGYENGNFGPDNSVTRGEMAKIAINVYNFSNEVVGL